MISLIVSIELDPEGWGRSFKGKKVRMRQKE